MRVVVSVGVAGHGRLRFACEELEETGGWCAGRLSSTPAGSSPRHTASRGQTHTHTHTSTQFERLCFLGVFFKGKSSFDIHLEFENQELRITEKLME